MNEYLQLYGTVKLLNNNFSILNIIAWLIEINLPRWTFRHARKAINIAVRLELYFLVLHLTNGNHPIITLRVVVVAVEVVKDEFGFLVYELLCAFWSVRLRVVLLNAVDTAVVLVPVEVVVCFVLPVYIFIENRFFCDFFPTGFFPDFLGFDFVRVVSVTFSSMILRPIRLLWDLELVTFLIIFFSITCICHISLHLTLHKLHVVGIAQEHWLIILSCRPRLDEPFIRVSLLLLQVFQVGLHVVFILRFIFWLLKLIISQFLDVLLLLFAKFDPLKRIIAWDTELNIFRLIQLNVVYSHIALWMLH